jgi:hypothetical protein
MKSLGHREHLIAAIQDLRVRRFPHKGFHFGPLQRVHVFLPCLAACSCPDLQICAVHPSHSPVDIFQAAKGMQRGPKPADFEAAMAAQQAPPKNPPRKIAEGIQDPSHDEKPLKWTSVQRTAWDQQGRDVDVYVCAETFVAALVDALCTCLLWCGCRLPMCWNA